MKESLKGHKICTIHVLESEEISIVKFSFQSSYRISKNFLRFIWNHKHPNAQKNCEQNK